MYVYNSNMFNNSCSYSVYIQQQLPLQCNCTKATRTAAVAVYMYISSCSYNVYVQQQHVQQKLQLPCKCTKATCTAAVAVAMYMYKSNVYSTSSRPVRTRYKYSETHNVQHARFLYTKVVQHKMDIHVYMCLWVCTTLRSDDKKLHRSTCLTQTVHNYIAHNYVYKSKSVMIKAPTSYRHIVFLFLFLFLSGDIKKLKHLKQNWLSAFWNKIKAHTKGWTECLIKKYAQMFRVILPFSSNNGQIIHQQTFTVIPPFQATVDR